MAFNFNWSPLAADASFYARAQQLLTAALNKSPKPPIIVDDISADELNLGSVPPDLEILEIGDLAEDRFRGIFKMRYAGDAFLTLKTRVQANPLNTYLSTRPSFTSPEPLAASSGLTIPIKITLSSIKLSAFIILVFSRQKGVTLVFRNDPLESLKVSSTFDSIPFVRDYLQKEIEGQLRALLINEVPAIIHRLSLRLLCPDHHLHSDETLPGQDAATIPEEPVSDPLASPPQDPVDANGHVLDAAQIASLTLNSTSESQSLFSQRNLLRLATLNSSNHTLSLFTPPLQDVLFRAWPGLPDQFDTGGVSGSFGPLLSRKHSHMASASLSTISNSSDSLSAAIGRPPLSAGLSYAGAPGIANKPGRRRKHRVVNLRKKKTRSVDDIASISGESSGYAASHSTSTTSETDPRSSEGRAAPSLSLTTPPSSPSTRHPHPRLSPGSIDHSPHKVDEPTPRPFRQMDVTSHPKDPISSLPLFAGTTPRGATGVTPRQTSSRFFSTFRMPSDADKHPAPSQDALLHNVGSGSNSYFPASTSVHSPSSSAATDAAPLLAAPFPYLESNPGGILEQAWMLKMAGEVARRVQEQKQQQQNQTDSHFWDSRPLGTPEALLSKP